MSKWGEELTVLKGEHNKYRERVLRARLAKEQEETNLVEYGNKIIELEGREITLLEVAQLCQSIAHSKNQEAKEVLEEVLNHALQQVELDSEYTAHLLQPETKRAVRGLYIKLVEEETGEERTPLTSTGTMVAQLISILMTIIVIKFSGRRKVLVLDEVLSGFSGLHSIPTFGNFLVTLAENEGFQIIMVEHKEQLAEVDGIHNINVEKSKGRLEVNSITRGGDGLEDED